MASPYPPALRFSEMKGEYPVQIEALRIPATACITGIIDKFMLVIKNPAVTAVGLFPAIGDPNVASP